jgi:hypothetical protein
MQQQTQYGNSKRERARNQSSHTAAMEEQTRKQKAQRNEEAES